jgi:IMP dehydrogenase
MSDIPIGYSLDDVLLIPQENNIDSRLDTDLTTRFSRRHTIPSPIMATNMSTITEKDMMVALYDSGGVAVLHRFLTKERGVEILSSLPSAVHPRVASVGIGDDELRRAEAYVGAGVDVLLIDIAHAHAPRIYHHIAQIRNINEKVDLIVGNIATYDAAYKLLSFGVDGLRVGIGGGSRCTTRTVTGHGVPNLTALVDVVYARKTFLTQTNDYIPIIIDGGINSSGDIVKSLAFGADVASMGGLFAGTKETPGPVVQEGQNMFKKFYGMSSKSGNLERYGVLKKGIAPEGFSELVPYRGSVKEVVEELQGGIRSGLTYSGASNIEELRLVAQPILLTVAARKESKL